MAAIEKHTPPTQDERNYLRWRYVVLLLIAAIAAIYLSGWLYGALRTIGHILALYFTAWLIQFFLTPPVDVLTRLRVKRALAVSAVYLAFIALVVVAMVPVTINLVNQGKNLVTTLGQRQTYDFILHTANNIETFLIAHGVHKHDIDTFTHDYSVNLNKGAISAGSRINDFITTNLKASTLGDHLPVFVGFLNTLSNLLLNTVLVLILSFYMTLDGHKLVRGALNYFPPSVHEVMEEVQVVINRKFGGYLRGQLILAVSYGLLTYFIAVGFGLQSYSVFIAVFAGLAMLVPFVGTFAAIVPPIIGFVLVHASDFSTGYFLLLLVFLFGSQQIVLNVLAPRVLGQSVGMHPLLVVLGLLLGAQFAGIWGALFGVPVFGVIVDTFDLAYRRIMHRRYGFDPPGGLLEHQPDEIVETQNLPSTDVPSARISPPLPATPRGPLPGPAKAQSTLYSPSDKGEVGP